MTQAPYPIFGRHAIGHFSWRPRLAVWMSAGPKLARGQGACWSAVLAKIPTPTVSATAASAKNNFMRSTFHKRSVQWTRGQLSGLEKPLSTPRHICPYEEQHNSLRSGKDRKLRQSTFRSCAAKISAGDVVNQSVSGSALAVFFGRAGDLSIEAAGSVTNKTARLFSNKSISITAGGTFTNETELTGNGRLTVSESAGRRSWRTLWIGRERETHLDVDYGTARIANEFGLVTGINDVVITASTILNRGGQISGDNITIKGIKGVQIESALTGSALFDQRCGYYVCDANGRSNVNVMAASVNAGSKLRITSDGEVSNVAGRLLSGADIIIIAPRISSRHLVLPTVVMRPQEPMVRDGLASSIEDIEAMATHLMQLHEDASRRDIAWRYGIGPTVLDHTVHRREFTNWLKTHVMPRAAEKCDRRVRSHYASGGTMIIHDMPNLSATEPNRGEKNVGPIGICTVPSLASASNN